MKLPESYKRAIREVINRALFNIEAGQLTQAAGQFEALAHALFNMQRRPTVEVEISPASDGANHHSQPMPAADAAGFNLLKNSNATGPIQQADAGH